MDSSAQECELLSGGMTKAGEEGFSPTDDGPTAGGERSGCRGCNGGGTEGCRCDKERGGDVLLDMLLPPPPPLLLLALLLLLQFVALILYRLLMKI